MKYVNKCGFRIRHEFGDMCKKNRQLRGYTQQDLADECFVSPATVREFERGTNDNLNIAIWHLTHGVSIDKVAQFIEQIHREFENGEI